MDSNKLPDTIDTYIARHPEPVRSILTRVRQAIRKAAPDAVEVISYKMPAFRLGRILVYFAAWKHHIGLYPPITGNDSLAKLAAKYAGPKGNLQFPLDEPIPYPLIQKIVRWRVKQTQAKRK